MPTQISVSQATLEPAKTIDGWHLHELYIRFNGTTLQGAEDPIPLIYAMFIPWYNDNGVKVAIPDKRKRVTISDPVRVGEIYDFYVKGNEQLGPVIENMVWREAQAQLDIPQSQIDALTVVTSVTPF